MTPDTQQKFSPVTTSLHWIVAIMMIGLLATGLYMYEFDVFQLYAWHKSFGITIVFFVLLRIFWRMKNGWPEPASQYQAWEHSLSHIIHWVLILSTILMPISGLMHSGGGGYGVQFFGIDFIPRNLADAADPQSRTPYWDFFDWGGGLLHKWIGYITIASVILHIVGAFKHHIVDKDGTLKRMLGAKI